MLHKGNILPPVKKMVSFQRGGLLICLLQRSLHPKRQIPDIQLSPVLPAQCRLWWIFSSSLPVPFGKLGISHISLVKIWGRGESKQEVGFHNRSKGRECVRKRVRVRGGQEGVVAPSLAAMCHLCHSGGTDQVLLMLVTV